MIEVQELCKRFGATDALDGACVTVPDGAVTAWWGPTGRGNPP